MEFVHNVSPQRAAMSSRVRMHEEERHLFLLFCCIVLVLLDPFKWRVQMLCWMPYGRARTYCSIGGKCTPLVCVMFALLTACGSGAVSKWVSVKVSK